LTAYGAQVEVPGNVDLLVAGTCCVDFSMLNGKRQKLEANGESGRTFFATLDYMKEFKPRMVIFENVKSAPWHGKMKDGEWQNGIDYHVKRAGYASRCIILDTKNYSIPHTRQRGYMLCLHMLVAYLTFYGNAQEPTEEQLAEFCDPENGGLANIFDKWEKTVRYFGRPASVSADAFLLDADDARITGIQEGELEEISRKPISWEKCKDGHFDYRSKLGLGNKRPLTSWSDNTYKLPDYFRFGQKGFTQRVLDTLDIYHAQNILRYIDDRHYA
jgi:site-specific DNA-cytosine methylase